MMADLILPPPPTPKENKRTVQTRTDPKYYKNKYQDIEYREKRIQYQREYRLKKKQVN